MSKKIGKPIEGRNESKTGIRQRYRSSFFSSSPLFPSENSSLWAIARKVYGDPAKWQLFFVANRALIKDPNLIYPDTKL